MSERRRTSELSKNVLQMKFMQREHEETLRRELEAEHAKEAAESHWVLKEKEKDGNDDDDDTLANEEERGNRVRKTRAAGVLFDESSQTSVAPLNAVGRRSFGQFNRSLEHARVASRDSKAIANRFDVLQRQEQQIKDRKRAQEERKLAAVGGDLSSGADASNEQMAEVFKFGLRYSSAPRAGDMQPRRQRKTAREAEAKRNKRNTKKKATDSSRTKTSNNDNGAEQRKRKRRRHK
jgi:M-phase phosphoprotein 6